MSKISWFRPNLARLRRPTLPETAALLYLTSLLLPALRIDGQPAYGLAVFAFGWVSASEVLQLQFPWAFMAWCANMPGALALSAAWSDKREPVWGFVATGAFILAMCTGPWLMFGTPVTASRYGVSLGFYCWVVSYALLALHFLRARPPAP